MYIQDSTLITKHINILKTNIINDVKIIKCTYTLHIRTIFIYKIMTIFLFCFVPIGKNILVLTAKNKISNFSQIQLK